MKTQPTKFSARRGVVAWIVAAAVLGIASGYLLGRWFHASAAHQGVERAAATRMAVAQAIPEIETPDPQSLSSQIARLAAVLSHGTAPELLAALQSVIQDRSLPQAFSDHAQRALVHALMRHGSAEPLLALKYGRVEARESAIEAIIEAQARHDPAGAESLIATIPAGRDRQLATRALLKAFGASDHERGLAFLRANPPAREVAYDFFGSWAATNPRQAADAALALQSEIGGYLLHAPIHDWAVSNPDEAWQWIESQKPEIRDSARQAYANGLANGDPEKALEVFLANPKLEDNFAVWVGRKLAANAMEAESVLGKLPPGELRTRVIEGMTQSLSQTDPVGAIEWSKTLLPGEGSAAIRGIFENLGQTDPQSAVDLALAHLDGADADLAIAAATRWWSYADPEGAFLGLVQQLDESRLSAILPNLVPRGNSVVGQDLARWIEWIAPLRPDLRQRSLNQMASVWAEYAPEAVLKNMETFSPADRAVFATELLRHGESSDPVLARDLIGVLAPQEAIAQVRGAAAAIAYRDAASAAQFVTDLHPEVESPARSEALKDILRDWAFEEPMAAEAFVAGLPNGKTKDQAARALAQQLSQFDLHAATRTLAYANQSSEREAMIRNLASQWKKVDARQGQAVLAQFLKSASEKRIARSVFEP